jgi:hypothetical protein
VLADGFELPAAFRKVLTDIAASDFAHLELVVINRQAQLPPEPTPGRFSRYLRLLRENKRRRHLLYALFQKLDQRGLEKPDPLEDIDCTDILGNCERLDVTPVTKGFVHRFPADAISAIRSYDLDVLLRFGFNILRGEVLRSARYGIWSFHHGDNEFYRGGPALFWEVVEDSPCSGVILQVLTEKLDDGSVLCKSLFATTRGLRPGRNLFLPYWGSTHLVIRKLNELQERGWEAVSRNSVPPAPYRGKSEIYRSPTNAQMLKWLVPRLAKKLVQRINPLRRPKSYHWRICLRRADSPRLMAGPSEDRSGFQWMECPPGHFYADPFLLEHQGQVWLFFEDYLYEEDRGRISCARVQPDLSLSDVTVCLDLPYHVSYPFVFHEDGEVFMIPESAQNDSVELWRATDFPFSWKLEKTLFRGSFADTTPIRHGDRWYFFTTMSEPPDNFTFGALFVADSLTGNWTHHPSSPISTDVRDARSAGRILNFQNRLLRPVQDCSENYGRRIHVEEILELTPDSCKRQRLHSIEPDWEKGLQGVHTYGYCAGIEVLDAVSFRDRSEVAV